MRPVCILTEVTKYILLTGLLQIERNCVTVCLCASFSDLWATLRNKIIRGIGGGNNSTKLEILTSCNKLYGLCSGCWKFLEISFIPCKCLADNFIVTFAETLSCSSVDT